MQPHALHAPMRPLLAPATPCKEALHNMSELMRDELALYRRPPQRPPRTETISRPSFRAAHIHCGVDHDTLATVDRQSLAAETLPSAH